MACVSLCVNFYLISSIASLSDLLYAYIIYLFIHSFIYLFIYLFIHSFIYSFIYLFIYLFRHHAIADYLLSQGLTESAELFKKETDLVRERERRDNFYVHFLIERPR